jgi:4-diphosphocytidyl-2-C-methyl-D-erythritol kinase
MREARVVAQAKINLFLRVLAREASGYHQLETLFQRLELGDDVAVRVDVAGRSLDCRGAATGPTDRNLAWRAATAYADAAAWPNGFAIEIDKHVPVGGGLGGGSADAGAVLRCLEALNPSPLGPAALLALAAPLGADVPFLTSDAPLALAWGRGERLLALPPLPARAAHLALFDEGVATGPAFAALAARRSDATPRPILWSTDRFARWDDVALIATNDFEDVVLPERSDIAELRAAFAQICRSLDVALADDAPADGEHDVSGDTVSFSLMTGSGATVFLLAPAREAGVVIALSPGDDVTVSPAFRIVETRTATRVAEVASRD